MGKVVPSTNHKLGNDQTSYSFTSAGRSNFIKIIQGRNFITVKDVKAVNPGQNFNLFHRSS